MIGRNARVAGRCKRAYFVFSRDFDWTRLLRFFYFENLLGKPIIGRTDVIHEFQSAPRHCVLVADCHCLLFLPAQWNSINTAAGLGLEKFARELNVTHLQRAPLRHLGSIIIAIPSHTRSHTPRQWSLLIWNRKKKTLKIKHSSIEDDLLVNFLPEKA